MASYTKKLMAQRKVEAQVRQARSGEKNRHVIQAGANLPSQWGKVVNNEKRLIDNGHYMKTAEGATLSAKREEYRDYKQMRELGLEFADYRVQKRLGTLDKPKKVIHVQKSRK